MFEFNDESGAFTFNRAEYQDFNRWHDVWSKDDRFKINYNETNFVSIAEMLTYNLDFSDWTYFKPTGGGSWWQENFYAADYRAWPKDEVFIAHDTPNNWSAQNISFVSTSLITRPKNNAQDGTSGLAGKLLGGGKGKACKNMRMLYILRSGESLPIQLALPPTSLKGYNDFVSAAFLSRKRGICAGVVQITLKKMTNGPHDYSIAVFKKLYDFTGEQLAAVRELSSAMRMQIKNMNEQRAINHATNAENICEYQDGAPVLPDNDAHFIPGIIDGERDELPA